MSDIVVPSLLKQVAVYWAPLGEDESGMMQYDEPVQIKCRWTDINRLYINQKAETAVSSCMVMVDRDLELGGALWQGEIENLDDRDEPAKNGANIIQGWTKVAMPNGKKFVRTAIC